MIAVCGGQPFRGNSVELFRRVERRDQKVLAEHVLVVARRLVVLRIFDIRAAHDRQAAVVVFAGKRVEQRQQAIAHADVFLNDVLRRFAEQPRHASVLTYLLHVGTVHAANRGQRAVLQPANVHIVRNGRGVSAEVGGHVRNTHLRAAEHRRVNFLRKRGRVRVDVARPLNGILMRGNIGRVVPTPVQASVHVAHYERAVGVLAEVCYGLQMLVGDELERVHARREYGNILVNRVERNRPVSVVPPIIETERKYGGELLVAVLNLLAVEQVARALDGLGMVVEHDIYAELVALVQKLRHVGEQLGVNLISYAVEPVIRMPILVQDEYVYAVTPVGVVLNLLHRRLFVVSVPARIPITEHLQRYHLAPARIRNVIVAKLLVIAVRQKHVAVGRVVAEIPTVERVGALAYSVAVFGRNNARAVAEIPAVERVGRAGYVNVGRGFARIPPQLLVGCGHNAHAVEARRVLRNVDFIVGRGDYAVAVHRGLGEIGRLLGVAVGHVKGVAVLEPRLALVLDAHHRIRQQPDANIVNRDIPLLFFGVGLIGVFGHILAAVVALAVFVLVNVLGAICGRVIRRIVLVAASGKNGSAERHSHNRRQKQ